MTWRKVWAVIGLASGGPIFLTEAISFRLTGRTCCQKQGKPRLLGQMFLDELCDENSAAARTLYRVGRILLAAVVTLAFYFCCGMILACSLLAWELPSIGVPGLLGSLVLEGSPSRHNQEPRIASHVGGGHGGEDGRRKADRKAFWGIEPTLRELPGLSAFSGSRGFV